MQSSRHNSIGLEVFALLISQMAIFFGESLNYHTERKTYNTSQFKRNNGTATKLNHKVTNNQNEEALKIQYILVTCKLFIYSNSLLTLMV